MTRRGNFGALLAVSLTLPWLFGNRGCELRTRVPDASVAASDAPVLVGSDGGAASSGDEPGQLACGTRGGVQCAEDQFCNFALDAECGATDRGGRCETKPQVCTREYAPVCGCDGHTYSTQCMANSAGVSVEHTGACEEAEPPSPGKTCGGIAGLRCAEGEFCNYEPEAGGQGCAGNIADAAGVCAPQPAACTFEYAPVCGCDRKTYPTRCAAHAAGLSALHEGECTASDCKAIGGRAVDGIGPPPECAKGEINHTNIVHDNGARSIEGTACCVPEA